MGERRGFGMAMAFVLIALERLACIVQSNMTSLIIINVLFILSIALD